MSGSLPDEVLGHRFGLDVDLDAEHLAARLANAGFLAADAEASLLVSHGAGDAAGLRRSVERRLSGEPLAWIIGETTFCGHRIEVWPGVYVPREHTRPLVERAVDLMASGGTMLDVCTGSGAVAAVVARSCPEARVFATDADALSVGCARTNGVAAYVGDLLEPLMQRNVGPFDLITGVVPYVPTSALATLQRDTFVHESTLAYDGGPDGTSIHRRVASECRTLLRDGAAVLLELGGTQADTLEPYLAGLGYTDIAVHVDSEGDPRAIEATYRAGTCAAEC